MLAPITRSSTLNHTGFTWQAYTLIAVSSVQLEFATLATQSPIGLLGTLSPGGVSGLGE
ncbi:hypothetical protein MIZ03_2556 [Rhodoferax lithotrophicus]|uniref:Uncharacterized protein n=1 Tax=Rhodoferax lithotrophicus TaxID=2798804 RepID=A0ABN6D6M3_9BURK|nr:hypothetical protein MIZ03_2556 [Rhodoferax sp. MIZ03]